jgi:hypothetical protein
MTTQEEREAELAREQEKRRGQWRLLDFLALGDGFKTCLTAQNLHAKDLQPFYSVSVTATKNYGRDLDMREALGIIEQFQARGDVQSVSRWKEPSSSAVWWPDECNISRTTPGAEKIGEAQVGLEAAGAARFHSRELSFWTRLPDGDRTFARLHLQLRRFPLKWEHSPRYKGFSPIDGRCTGMSIEPPSGLPDAYVRKGMGSVDHWRSEYYWETVQAFTDQLWEVGLP